MSIDPFLFLLNNKAKQSLPTALEEFLLKPSNQMSKSPLIKPTLLQYPSILILFYVIIQYPDGFSVRLLNKLVNLMII